MTSNTSDPKEVLAFESREKTSNDTGSSDSHESPDPVSSNCLRWAENLQELLNDPDGLNLFQQYLEQEDDDRFHMLKFWYACRGVSQQGDAKKADQAVKVIYRNLFLKIKSGIRDDVKSTLAVQIKEAKSKKNDPSGILLNASIFNDACKIVEKEMSDVMYPNFLNSDIYLSYVQRMQGDHCNIDNSNREAPALPDDQDDELPLTLSQTLPVVDEDKELTLDKSSFEKPNRSSKSFLGRLGFSSSTRRPSNLRLYYSSFTQNSELQSVSSGARTDSLLDLTIDDASTSKNTYTYQRQLKMQMQQGIRNCEINPNPDKDIPFSFVPLTSRPQAKEMTKPREPADFAQELMNKLEILKKDRDSSELMNKKLNSIEAGRNDNGSNIEHEMTGDNFFDDDDQEILDKHVSRIWSDKTPRRSPSVGTPVRPKSPDSRKSWLAHTSNKPSSRNFPPSHHGGSGSVKLKSKDMYSVFSIDSGNYTDPTEGRDNHHRHLPPRVKSVSEYGNAPSEHHYPSSSGYHPRSNRAWSASRRTLTDSGVSDIENPGSTTHLYKEKLVSSWLSADDKICRAYPSKNSAFSAISEENTFVSSSSSSKHRAKSASSHPRTKTGSSDRNGSGSSCSKNVLPGHLFVQDPNIPPYPYHNIATEIQLEETARRLEAGQKSSRSTAGSHGSCATTRACDAVYRASHLQSSSKTENCQRSATLARSNHHKPYTEESARSRSAGEDPSLYTHVVYNFSDEQMPYLLKVPGNPITLRSFKEFMPPNKVGRYRFFFVKQCEELNNQPIQEEIIDDNEILPFFRGKVNAQIKAIE